MVRTCPSGFQSPRWRPQARPVSCLMKTALKYGIAVTVAIAAWVALKHFVLHLESPAAQIADVLIFNLAAITGLMFGIKEKRRLNGGTLIFGNGLVTGIRIPMTYAVLTLAYFP